MRVVRIILSLLFLLAAVALGVLSYLAATRDTLKGASIALNKFLPGALIEAAPALDVKIQLTYMLIGAAVVVLLIAGIFWPPYRPRRLREPKKGKKGALGTQAEGATVSSVLDAIPASSGTAHNLPAAQADGLTGELDAADAQSQNELDEGELRELINMEQQSIDKDIASDIVKRSYPHLVPLIPMFYDEASLAAMARQIIAVLRFRVKLKDKSLSSYQFSQFEDRAYQTEEERILYRYSPKNAAALDDRQKGYIGKIFAQSSYRGVQQQLLAARDDWEHLSVKDLH
jgi:hypothetical protein